MGSRATLSKKLRRHNGHRGETGTKTVPLPAEIKAFVLQTESKAPTFAGACCLLWKDLQIWRAWAESTAETYGKTLTKHILPRFDNRAFEDLDEDDYMEIWESLCKCLSVSSLETASVIIRAIVELGFQKGLTSVTLWGLPMLPDYSDMVKPKRRKSGIKQEEELGERLATEAMRVPKSVSLETEFAMAKAMLDNCAEHGELIAGLIMLCDGVRTSEATGFSYGHLCEVAPGYWALVRYEVSEKDSRKTKGGAKTNNAFRLLPVPNFLVRLLLERKNHIAAQYPDISREELNKFPLACKGEDFKTRCTQKELNEKLKLVFQQTEVPEDLMAYAYLDMQKNPDLAEECEGKATAYLLRRMFATAAVYCRLTPGEIYNLMGHVVADGVTKKADFSNPDKFLPLAEKVFSRPLIQVFDAAPEYRKYVYTGGRLTLSDTAAANIEIPEARDIRISVVTLVDGDVLEVESSGITWSIRQDFALPEGGGRSHLNIRRYLWQQGQTAWERVRTQRVVLQKPTRIETEIEWDIFLKEPDVLLSAALPPRQKGSRLLEEVNADLEKHNDNEQQETDERMTTPRETKKRLETRLIGYADSQNVHYITDQGQIVRAARPVEIQQRRLVGRRISEIDQSQRPVAAFCYDMRENAFVISRTGVLYRIEEGTDLASPEFCAEENPAYRALRSGGIFLRATSDNDSIVCLASSGGVRRVSMRHLKRIPKEGRLLVQLSESETLVAACLCSEQSEILIVSKRGKALRIAGDSLRAVLGMGASLYVGMALRSDDRAVACIPYETGTDILMLTQSGKAIRMKGDYEILPHRRGGFGVAVAKLENGDGVFCAFPLLGEEALHVVSNQGRSLCVELKGVPSVSSAAKGVQTMQLRPGQALISGIPLPMKLTKDVDLGETIDE